MVPGVVVGVVLVTVVAGGEALGGRGRGVARVDGTGSPPAQPPAAVLVLVLVLQLVEVVELAVLVVVPLVPLPLLQVCWEAAACMALALACSASLAFFLPFSLSSFILFSVAAFSNSSLAFIILQVCCLSFLLTSLITNKLS